MTTSSTVMRAFAGILDVGGEPIPATLRFVNGSVSLIVGNDEVGSWPRSDVSLESDDGSYRIEAEGESVAFTPDDATGFGAFVGEAQAPAAEAEPSKAVEFEVPEPPEPVDHSPHSPLLPDLTARDEGTALDQDEEPTEPALAVDEPDEMYAAGIDGADVPAPSFGSARVDSPTPTHTDPVGPVEERAEVTSQEQDVTPVPHPDRSDRADITEEADPAPVGDFPTPEDDQPEAPVDPTPAAEEDDEEAEAGSASAKSLMTRMREKRSRKTTEAVAEPEPEADDEVLEPITDQENLRQWALVVAGGVVVVAVLGVVVWGILSLIGGDEVAATPADEATPATVAQTVPVIPTTVPTTALPPTTVPAENRQAAGTFVAGWNAIAQDYAYHLSVDGDTLPISSALTSTIQLNYGEDGVVEMLMAPQGGGGDRDILVAMGMAVTWAEPDLGPQGRKQVLASMGIDVDNPVVDDMGGQTTRNGVTYQAAVEDGVIRFQVNPNR